MITLFYLWATTYKTSHSLRTTSLPTFSAVRERSSWLLRSQPAERTRGASVSGGRETRTQVMRWAPRPVTHRRKYFFIKFVWGISFRRSVERLSGGLTESCRDAAVAPTAGEEFFFLPASTFDRRSAQCCCCCFFKLFFCVCEFASIKKLCLVFMAWMATRTPAAISLRLQVLIVISW